MSVTIKDIAKHANVSHTTVSRALNNSPIIKEETKKRIQEIAKMFNYTPNYNAKSLVLQKSYNIGIFFSSIDKGTSPTFFYEVVEGVNSIIPEKYTLLVRGIDKYKDFSEVNNKRFDGIIVISQSESDNAFIYSAVEKKIPLVVLNREIHDTTIVNILTEEQNGAYCGTKYLIENGHRNIAIIEGIKGFKSAIDRKDGFLKALIENKINIKKEYIVPGNYDIKSGYNGMKALLKLPKGPTAVFCSNDDMAVGAIKAVFEAGLKVPEDISIVGFDDSDFCKYITPELTTIKKPIRELSIKGTEKLLGILDKKENSGEKIYIPTNLVIRKTVANIKR
jgi:LacI family transcriptional regulator, purine nucleotide synthesis repressor